ncbi:g6505 [Coccomyxa viridis]|uniref:G6505 protein n=1 Tax=Coccomyxa viridis TaxID=1274662 RepID=A0ABP1FVI8_9CHLO
MKNAALSNDLWRNRFRDLPEEFRAFVESRRLYPWLWHALYHTNLLSNVNWGNITGHNNWLMNSSGWRVTLHGGHGWQAESPPQATPPLDVKPLPRLGAAPINTAGALASSYLWCEVMQAVDVHMELQKRGMSHACAEAYLDGGPELTFAVWCGGRNDCASIAKIMVVLDSGEDVLPPYTGRADFPWQRTAITHWESGPIDLTPQNNAWKLATHTFKGYPAGVRRALIVLRGKDEPFWAGWYGAKFAAPELHFGGSRWSDGAEPLKGNT